MINTAVAERTNNKPLPVAYNVVIGVDALKQKKESSVVEVQNSVEFRQLLKIGIYKSLCAEGIISRRRLMQLIQMQRNKELW